MDALALVGSVGGLIGAGTGAASLIWTVHHTSQSRARVVVTSANGFHIVPGVGTGHYLQVTATNTGGAAIDVRGWGIEISPGRDMAIFAPVPLSTRLPSRLESGSLANFYADPDSVRGTASAEKVALSRLRPWVSLGNGEKVYQHKPGVPLT